MSHTPNIRFKGFTDDWEQRKCSEFISFVGGATPYKGNSEYWGGDIVWLSSQEINKGGFVEKGTYTITQKAIDDGATKMVDADTPLFISRSGLLAHSFPIARPTKAVAINQDIKGMLFDKSRYATDFIVYMMESKDDYILKSIVKSGTTVQSVNMTDLEKMSVFIPNMSEQEVIGAFFANLDNTITLHQRECDKTKDLKKYMLQKMFPKNGESVPEIRFDGFTDPWEQRKLSDLIIEYKETVDSECTLPVLTSSKTEGVVLQEEHFGRVQNHDITGYNILPRNYCTYRNRSDGVDFTFNINRCCDKGIISKFYPVFYGNNSDIFFISMVLNYCDEVVHEIAYTCTGTGQKVLSFLDLQKMNIRVPSYDEQKKISQYFEQLDNLITLHQRKCDELKEIKKYMLQNMFPGK